MRTLSLATETGTHSANCAARVVVVAVLTQRQVPAQSGSEEGFLRVCLRYFSHSVLMNVSAHFSALERSQL